MTIFFTYTGKSEDDLRALGLLYHGDAYFSTTVAGTIYGVVLNAHPNARVALENIPGIVVSPGPNGKIHKKHVGVIPNVKEGDAFRDTLSIVFAACNHPAFDPDAY